MIPQSKINRAWAVLFSLAIFALCAPALQAQQRREPHIGYVFPAGGQRGTVFETVIGGQFLDGAKDLYVSGSGIKATVTKFERPLPPKRLNELRDYLQEARKKAMESGSSPAELRGLDGPERIAVTLKEAGATDDEIKAFQEQRKERADPKRQQNVQLSERVIVRVEIAADAVPGPRQLRLLTPMGLSNPLSFCIGTLPEQRDADTNAAVASGTAPPVSLPVVWNGQILPGGVDRLTFEAKQGAHLVVAVQARDLLPYLADAVPGWFQPVATLYNAKGKEVAYAGDFRFSPDPIFCYDAPETGVYSLEIRDALYRGREDFVFRVTAGEIPFITSIFPLGGRVSAPTRVDVAGWNITRKHFVLTPTDVEGIHSVPELGNGLVTSDPLFLTDSLPVRMEEEPNNTLNQAQVVTLPVAINGRINPAGDVDVYTFSCRAGAKIVAEVTARRLDSPLDSWLKITDATGRQLAFNDDWEDQGAGLITHQADSYLTFTAPAKGQYYLYIGDAQGKGGPEYAYRLRISAPRPDFALRFVPSCVNGSPGATIPVTVYALRKDGFSGDISFALKGAPEGVALNGGLIPAGQDKVRATLTLPEGPAEQPMKLAVEGHATIEGHDISRQAVPAEDMMQAFMIHHLVASNELLVVVSGTGRARAPLDVVSGPMKLPAGGVGQAVLSSPFRRAPFILTQTQLQLNEPPEGISLEGTSVTDAGVAVRFRANAAKVKPGMKGNLIVEAFVERTPPATPDGKVPEKKRFSAGFLPAIPFEITGP